MNTSGPGWAIPVCRYRRGRRVISVPSAETARQQHAFLADVVYQQLKIPESIREVMMTGLPGSPPAIEGACRHSGNRYVYQTDLVNAFGSVDLNLLQEALVWADCFYPWAALGSAVSFVAHEVGPNNAGVDDADIQEAIRDQVLDLIIEWFFDMEYGGLPQGSPASPVLFNIYAAYVLDSWLVALAQAHNLTYTRFADDLTFSSPEQITAKVRSDIRWIIKEAGFHVAHHKSFLNDLHATPVVITGVGIAKGGTRLFLPQEKRNKITAILRAACAGANIPPGTVHGLMSLFVHIYPRQKSPYKGSAGKIWRLYAKWRLQQAVP